MPRRFFLHLLKVIHTFRVAVTGQAVLPSVISIRASRPDRSVRRRRLRTAVSVTAEGDATENTISARHAVAVVPCRSTAVIACRTAIITAAATTARSITRTAAGLALTSARVTRDDISASITASALITAVPVTTYKASVVKSICRIYRRARSARTTAVPVNTRITKVAHSISYPFVYLREISYYMICSRA